MARSLAFPCLAVRLHVATAQRYLSGNLPYPLWVRDFSPGKQTRCHPFPGGSDAPLGGGWDQSARRALARSDNRLIVEARALLSALHPMR